MIEVFGPNNTYVVFLPVHSFRRHVISVRTVLVVTLIISLILLGRSTVKLLFSLCDQLEIGG